MNEQKYAVISLSGGMDSSTLLLRLLADGYKVTALSFDYGQKHKIELEKATDLVNYINKTQFKNSDFRLESYSEWSDLYSVKHQIIKLDGLSTLLNSSLVTGGEEVPEGHYAEESMKSTVVPNRNKIFSSIIQAVALSISEKNNSECVIAMGIHAGDHAIYPDCRQEFRDADYEAFKLGNWGAENVKLFTPYLQSNKYHILKDGEKCIEHLGLDFNEVYSRTLTSYKPIFYEGTLEYVGKSGTEDYEDNNNWDRVDRGWYSDYKSSSSVERIEAFIELGRPDPAKYANEHGPVHWETVVQHVKNII